MNRYVLPGSIRSKKNSKQPAPIPAKGRTTLFKLFKGKMSPVRIILVPSKAYKTWEKEARQAAMIQHPPHRAMFSTPVHVRVTAYCKGALPDLSGVMESVGDCLEGLAWQNDKLITSWDGSRVYRDTKNPRTIVEVEAYREGV